MIRGHALLPMSATTPLLREVTIKGLETGASIIVNGRDLSNMVTGTQIEMGVSGVTRVTLDCIAEVGFEGLADVGFKFDVRFPLPENLLNEPDALRAIADGLRRLADDFDLSASA